jgi:hypothetical protein
MAVVVSIITGVGVLIPVLGWAIPQLQAIPSLQPDEERMYGEDVSNRMILYIIFNK